jgi:glucose-1-phosphate adenylyltransferase
MAREKVLVMILAGGKGSRLEALTAERAKPALPFGGTYRLIDFALSNCVHSGLSDVWVVEQYQLHSLNDHLANGRPWDLDRTYGGLQVLPPFTAKGGGDEAEVSRGNADALCLHRHLIRDFAPDLLIVLSADHVYKLDFRDVIDRHRDTGAALTLVTTRVPLAEAGRFGTVEVGDAGIGKVTAFAYKPEKPASDLITTEVFVYTTEPLLRRLDELAESDKELGDFGDELLPGLVAEGSVYEHRLEGYWRDVGTIESYWQGHQDLLAPEAALSLDEPDWPILTYGVQRRPARIYAGAEIEDSLISPGCTIQGRVVRSVLAPGVFVGPGALVRDSVILHDARIGQGAVVGRAIVDEQAEIEAGARAGASDAGDGITVVGRRERVAGSRQK